MLIEGVPANTKISRAVQQHIFSLLQSCCNNIRTLLQIHTHVVIHGLSQKNYIIAKLLSFYIASGRLQPAQKIFQKIEKPSTSVWNQIIKGHGCSEMPWKSVELYNQMVATESEPDEYTYSIVLSACARGGLVREGEQVHGRVLVHGHFCNVFVETNLINLYSRAGDDVGVARAQHVFDEMSQRSIVSWNSILAGYIRHRDFDGARRIFHKMPHRNIVSWTTMIAGFAQNGKSKQALSLFDELRRNRVDLDQVALVPVLSACAELGDLQLGRGIHWYIQDILNAKNQQPLVSLSNALIHMYASCGIIDEAYKEFNKMPRKSTVSWTSMIMAFAKQGRGEEALNLFKKMVSEGINEVRPDEITFIGVLCACSHAGFVDEGRQLFASMNQTWGINPRIEHYGCMVDLLSRAGLLDEAHGLIETMPIKPNDAVWGALLGGCRKHKNAELASRVERKLIAELNTDQAAGYLVLLSNVYAFAKRWQDVISVRQKMIVMGVKKPPGRSWIQINGVVHDFMAGDMITHKHSSLIYEMLCKITKQALEEGYEPDMREVSLDIEG